MNTSLQLLRELASFADQFIGPETPARIDNASRKFSAMADVEAAMWMQLAVELGVFAADDVDRLAGRHEQRILESIRFVDATGLSRLFGEFSIFASNMLGTGRLSLGSFTHPYRLSRELFDKEMLRILMHEVGREFRDEVFTTHAMFDSSEEWDRLLEYDPNPDVILESQHLQGIDLLTDRYLAFLDHAGNLREFWGQFETSDSGSYGASELSRRARAMHGWRLDLSEENVKRRIESLTGVLIRGMEYDQELSDLGFDVADLQGRIEELCRSWSGDETLNLDIPFDERGGARRVA
jgi:hypothetical protein